MGVGVYGDEGAVVIEVQRCRNVVAALVPVVRKAQQREMGQDDSGVEGEVLDK